MNKYVIIKDIIIPTICAIIGGAFTFIGVKLTIKHEKEKEEEEKILTNKPLFWRINSMQEYDYKSSTVYALEAKDEKDIALNDSDSIGGIFKNTDNAIFVIKYVLINNKKYFPINRDVVDKNQIFNLYIKMKEKYKENSNITLVVTDILNNEYEYKLELNEKKEVESIREIKK